MAEIVNLRLARKNAARKVREATAAENRASSSIPGKVRRREAEIRRIEESRLDAKRIERLEPDGE